MCRRLSALLIPLALAGCATLPGGSAGEGLRANVAHGRDGVRVSLSEPAYVAIFHVVPGKRVSMFYPAVESDPARIDAGRTTVISGNRRLNQVQRAASSRGAPHVYMIASRQPLDEVRIRHLQTGEVSLPADLDPAATMGLLTSLVVPAETPATDVAADVAAMYRPVRRYAARGSSIPVMPPEKGTTDCSGRLESQVTCPGSGQREQDGFGGHRVDDNVNPPPD